MNKSVVLAAAAAGIIGATTTVAVTADDSAPVTCEYVVEMYPDGSKLVWCPPLVTTTMPTPTTVPVTEPPTTTTTTTTTTTVAPTTTTTLPPARQPFLLGATVDRQGTETLAQATGNFETAIGNNLDIARRFTGTFPTSFASVGTFAVDTGVRDRFISVKGTPTLGQWVTFLKSIPADGFETWVAINHEPENDGGTMTPTVFKAKNALMLQAIRQVNRADLHPALVLMTWLERDGNSTTSSAQWFPDEPWAFTLGIDPYDPNNRLQLVDLSSATITLWKLAGGQSWMVTETGTHRTGADGVAWIRAAGVYCGSDPGCGAIMWFHSAVGAEGPWWLSDALMQQAYGDLVP